MKHLVIIGAGIAGLAAAIASAENVDQITLVDRDALPALPASRSGAIQSYHSHLLTHAGEKALESLAPGMTQILKSGGAQPFDWGNSILDSVRGRFSTFDGLVTTACSRALFEHSLRQYAEALQNISVIERTRVTGLQVTKGQVSAVEIGDKQIPCDGLIIASGAASPIEAWLGTEVKQKTSKISLAYATRTYAGSWERNIVVVPEPIGGAAYQIEDNKVMVTLATTGLDGVLPKDDDKFEAFARGITSEFAKLAELTPLTSIRGFQRDTCSWRQFHRASLPTNMLITGDAVSTFNPVFGQGMSVAILSALVLRNNWRAGIISMAQAQRDIAKVIAPVWKLTVHSQPDKKTVVNKVLGAAQEKAVSDASAARRLIEVLQLMRPPEALLTPSILWQTAKELAM